MRPFVSLAALSLLAAPCAAQIAGGSVYGGGRENPAEVLRQQRAISDADVPPTLNSFFVDAAVLMNVPADAFVAVFGLSEEGTTLAEARERVRAKRAAFLRDLKARGVAAGRVTTDFVAQNRIYGYDLSGNVATERVTGFETKENVAVRCGSRAEVDALIELAARSGVYDLIKVDYVLTDVATVRSRLLAEAAKVVHGKRLDYERLLGIKARPSPQPYADRFNLFLPTEAYSAYQAAEGESLTNGYALRDFVVKGARKVRTFYYSPLSAKGFDRVVNPVVTEPVVQCTLFLKLRFESGPDRRPTPKAKP